MYIIPISLRPTYQGIYGISWCTLITMLLPLIPPRNKGSKEGVIMTLKVVVYGYTSRPPFWGSKIPPPYIRRECTFSSDVWHHQDPGVYTSEGTVHSPRMYGTIIMYPLNVQHSGYFMVPPFSSILLSGLLVLYTTHSLVETLNLAIICYVVGVGLHGVCTCSRVLYTLSVYVEMIWLLTPTACVVVMIVRVLIMQCSEEEIAYETSLHTSLCISYTTTTRGIHHGVHVTTY